MAFNLNKFTEKAQEAIIAAPQLAAELNHAQVEPEHLLVTLSEQAEGVVPSVLRKLNADPQKVARDLRDHLAKLPKAYGGAEPGLSPRMRVVLDAAQADAKAMQDEFVSTEHLLLGLLSEPGKSASADILKGARIVRERVLEALTAIRGNSASPIRIRKTSTRRSKNTVVTSPSLRARASSIPSSAATKKSGASSRCCHAARRTIPCSSASLASAKPQSSKASPNASSGATCLKVSRTSASSGSIWGRSSPARSSAANSRSA
jgi:ATP-dependent Clp protease ATP-binding subunit ClpA